MSTICEKCGAVHEEDQTCESIFHEFLALEFTDPGYGQVHFLTVACYMIQHEGYSDELYTWAQSALRKYLEEGYTSEMLRQFANEGPGRSKGIRRPMDAGPLPKVKWSMTIADVAKHMRDAESYCNLVKQWGIATLNEMGPLVLKK